MTILEEGIDDPATSKVTLFFEGKKDNRIPVHNQSLRDVKTGMFKTHGRILGHSLLHGGPGMYGISRAVKEYLASDVHSIDIQTLLVTIEDLPDIHLRNVLLEVLEIVTRAVCGSRNFKSVLAFFKLKVLHQFGFGLGEGLIQISRFTAQLQL